jgi:Caspase domain
MPTDATYSPKYNTSWGLVIGINDYQTASPLNYAREDAEAFAQILKSAFGFATEKITVLLDASATRHNIRSAFLDFTHDAVESDDRIAVFFAGHGCTRTGKRGEIGFLVPVEGDPNDLSTLVRWDELTRNAELIPAKHVLFLMDACYGGLAVRRNTPPGSARFLKDMLKRYSRQVLTAGKADETVADSGGPRPNHSIFTGHLLDALDGKAADSNGIISANAVMAYVYDHVAKDPHSRQSPHFGFLDGDGDFIFSAPQLVEISKNEKEDLDILVQVPASASLSAELSDMQTLVDRVKDYISEPRYRIRLDDLVAAEIRAASYEIREDEFPLQTATVTSVDIADRLRKYQEALSRLTAVTILLGRWGSLDHQPLIERIIARLADGTEPRSGKTAWLGLRWYPIMLLLYSGGIAAVSSHNYRSLTTLLTTKLRGSTTGKQAQPVVVSTIEEILELDRMELFKALSGYENYHIPRSEYLFKALQPQLEDLLFLGNGYEDDFDRFEILYALTYLDLQTRLSGYTWAPPGRFGWKERHGHSSYDSVLNEARSRGDSWGPVSAGLFRGSFERFNELAIAFREQVLDKLPWY